MKSDASQTVEVEVLEIDGKIIQPTPESSHPSSTHPSRHWQKHILQLDRRWWPLWIIGGAVLMVLFLTFGIVAFLLYLVWKWVKYFANLLRHALG